MICGWPVAAYLLWQTSVPSNLNPPRVKAASLVSARALSEARSFTRVEALLILGSMLTLLAVLAVYAVIGPRFTRESAAGPIGTGIMLAILGVGIVYVIQIPWGILTLWWERHKHIADTSYGAWVGLYIDQVWFKALIMSLAILIVVGFARLVGERWWLLAVPVWVGLLLLVTFVSPYLLSGQTHSLASPRLSAAAQRLARDEGASGVPVRVLDVGGPPNAVSLGVGPSRRVLLWDTLVDGSFSDRQVEVVIAHEFGHHAHDHLWKLLGLEALFLIPAGIVVARLTRRRGGMREPAAVPLGLLVFFALQFLAVPALNAASRRMEAEADWSALRATHDPAADRALFQRFVVTSLDDPSPPWWDYVLFADHPTIAQRVAMADAWQRRNRQAAQATSAQSP
ncbi:MAG: M48 family metalloprotease [Gaiellaceae bacterium]